MKVNYFPRHKQTENLITDNTVLLLYRLYDYSPTKFSVFMNQLVFSDSFDSEVVFETQKKNKNKGKRSSVPDALIFQDSYRVIVETKGNGASFSIKQLMNHLGGFGNENHKVLLTLDKELMDASLKTEFEERLSKYNEQQSVPVMHINITFEQLINAIDDSLSDYDIELKELLEDFICFCSDCDLLSTEEKTCIMQLSTTSYKVNIDNDIYYCPSHRNFRLHKYIGLYNDKSMRAIGKVKKVIVANIDSNGDVICDLNNCSSEDVERIKKVVVDAKKVGHNLYLDEHSFYIVEKFYETDFRKTSKGGSQKWRYFDLNEILNRKELPENVEEIAEELKKYTWE